MAILEAVAAKMGCSPQALRLLMRTGRCPFGDVLQSKTNGNFHYILYPAKVREYVGEVEGLPQESELEREKRQALQEAHEIRMADAISSLEVPREKVKRESKKVTIVERAAAIMASKAAKGESIPEEVFVPNGRFVA